MALRGLNKPAAATGCSRQSAVRPFVLHARSIRNSRRATSTVLAAQSSTAQTAYTTTNGVAAYPTLAPLDGELHALPSTLSSSQS